MSTIDQTLADRGQRYGEFTGHAYVTQNLKSAMVDSTQWVFIDDDQRECLEMVAHKIGRILNGDPNYIDSWTDIIGYTRLVEKRLIAEQESAKALMQEGESAKQMPLFGTVDDRNLSSQQIKDREARAALDAEQCGCDDCEIVRAIAEQLKSTAKVVDLDAARKIKAAEIDIETRLKAMEEKFHATLRIINAGGVRFA